MRNVLAALRTAWRLTKPYWVSTERARGWLLLATIVVLSLAQVYISVRLNAWNAVFYNALQDKKFDVFIHQLGVFTVLATCAIAAGVYRQYFNQMLQITWRQWMTRDYQARWLSDRSYYHLQSHGTTDNPDQRIADDIDQFTSSTLSLSIGLLSSVVTLVSFVAILWGLSGALHFTLLGHFVTIPGYMVWAALLYSCVGTWLTHVIGRRLVSLNFDQQRFEANFRYSLIRVREYAETIAFYRGEAVEQHTLAGRFRDIVGNWWSIMRKQKQLTWFTSGYSQIAIIFPFVVAAPRYFAGEIQLGGLMQTASAFNQVQGALSWFIDVYSQFASWKATVNRLSGFVQAMGAAKEETRVQSLIFVRSNSERFALQHLTLNLPDGKRLIEDFNLSMSAGERLLISGPSGCGKTTLLRSIAGLWPHASGEIDLPEHAKLLFIPQKPYLPLLPLRDVVCYPHAGDTFTDTAIVEALTTVGLVALVPSLDAAHHWSQTLSPGEQQKLAFARMLLHRPDILLLDEVTAALDNASEAQLYQMLIDRLPRAMIVSIGHRQSLAEWHTQRIAL